MRLFVSELIVKSYRRVTISIVWVFWYNGVKACYDDDDDDEGTKRCSGAFDFILSLTILITI